MKQRLKYEEKTLFFYYDTIIPGNIKTTVIPRNVNRNLKEFNIDIDGLNDLKMSKRENFVICTMQGTENVKKETGIDLGQFLITQESILEEIELPELQSALKPAFDLLEIRTLQDAINYNNQNTNK
jgi:hypothetical protein